MYLIDIMDNIDVFNILRGHCRADFRFVCNPHELGLRIILSDWVKFKPNIEYFLVNPICYPNLALFYLKVLGNAEK